MGSPHEDESAVPSQVHFEQQDTVRGRLRREAERRDVHRVPELHRGHGHAELVDRARSAADIPVVHGYHAHHEQQRQYVILVLVLVLLIVLFPGRHVARVRHEGRGAAIPHHGRARGRGGAAAAPGAAVPPPGRQTGGRRGGVHGRGDTQGDTAGLRVAATQYGVERDAVAGAAMGAEEQPAPTASAGIVRGRSGRRHGHQRIQEVPIGGRRIGRAAIVDGHAEKRRVPRQGLHRRVRLRGG